MGRSKQVAFTQEMKRRLQGVVLPPKLKCCRCDRHLNEESYSDNQLNEARYAVRFKGANASYSIKCRRCVGGQLVEIECSMCGKTKGLEAFAKGQRNKPDRAKCFACVDKQLDQQPISEYMKTKTFQTPNTSAGKIPEYWNPDSTALSHASQAGDRYGSDDEDGGAKLASNMNALSLNQANPITDTLIDTSPWGTGKASYGGPVREGQDTIDTSSWHTKSTTPSMATSGFNPYAYGHKGASSVAGSAKTFDSNVAASNVTSRGGWAKVPAYKPDPVPELDDWESESEDDADSDDDDDDDDIEI